MAIPAADREKYSDVIKTLLGQNGKLLLQMVEKERNSNGVVNSLFDKLWNQDLLDQRGVEALYPKYSVNLVQSKVIDDVQKTNSYGKVTEKYYLVHR